ncbi:MAG: type II secretion system protein, partial [Myxococcota bacterium]
MTMTMRQFAARHRVRRGFTMVELIVTISIIAVLVALTVYAASSLVLRSETQRTQDALKLLESAAQEWSIASERQITFGDDDTPPGAFYEIKWGDLELPNYFASVEDEAQFIGPLNQSEVDDLTRKFIRKIEKTPAVREMLARIDSKLLRKGKDQDTNPPDSPDWTLIR